MFTAILLAITLTPFQANFASEFNKESIVAVLTFESGKSILTTDLATMNPSAHGCGIVLSSDGLILTTRRQLGLLEGTKWKVLVRHADQPKGKLYPAELIAADAWSDLAVLKIDASDLKPIAFSEPEYKTEIGQSVSWASDFQAIKTATPFELGRGTIAKTSSSMLTHWQTVFANGGLLEIKREIDLESKSSVFSGGAVVDESGHLIGIIMALVPKTFATTHVAIPIDSSTREVVVLLQQGRLPNYGYLGATTRDLSDAQKAMYGGLSGVQIIDVDDRSDAAVAGLRFSDVITHVDEVPIENSTQLTGLIARRLADQTVALRIQRGSLDQSEQIQSLTVDVELSKRRIDVTLSSWQSASETNWRGLSVEYPSAVQHHKALALLIDRQGCVVVTKVKADSIAWKAGLRPMMVIREVNGQQVKTPSDFFAKTNLSGLNPVHLTVIDSATLEPRELRIDTD